MSHGMRVCVVGVGSGKTWSERGCLGILQVDVFPVRVVVGWCQWTSQTQKTGLGVQQFRGSVGRTVKSQAEGLRTISERAPLDICLLGL